MLPRHERRRLEEIESQLADEDPEFARRMTDAAAVRWSLLLRSPIVVLATVAAGSALLCLVLGDLFAFVIASMLVFALAVASQCEIHIE